MLHAHGKPGAIDKVDDRQMESVAQIHMPGDLIAGISCPGAIKEEGIARHDTNGEAVNPRKSGGDAAAPMLTDRSRQAAGRVLSTARSRKQK